MASTKLFTVKKRRQHFLVTDLTDRGRSLVMGYARQLVHWGVRKESGRWSKAPLKIFAASPYDHSEIRFHTNSWESFVEHLSHHITKDDYAVVDEPPGEGTDVDVFVKENWKLRENQKPAANYILDDRGHPQKLLGLQTGFGKAQPNEAKVLTPSGFVRLTDLTIGSVIIRHDGFHSKVEALYPQGEADIYEFVFDDGRRTEACPNHLWRIYSQRDTERWRLLSLNDIKEKGLNVGEYVYFPLYIPDTTSPDLPGLEDPYETGAKQNNPDRKYLKGSYTQRLDVLRGTLDHSDVRFTNEGIVLDTVTREHGLFIQELVWSLGGWCRFESDELSHQCLIRHPEPQLLFIRRDLYREAGENCEKLRTYFMRLASFSFKGTFEATCIKTENDEELYVTDDYIVTHNTFISIYSLSRLGKRAMYIMRPMYMDKWRMDFEAIYENGLDDVLMIRGGADLRALFQAGIDGTLEASTIVISNKTYQAYLSEYEKYSKDFLDHGWNLMPDDVWETLGIGALAIDEVHQDFHLNFKIMLYANVNLSVAMSATFISDDAFVVKMQNLYCPVGDRFTGGDYNRYVSASSYAFQFAEPHRIRTTEWGDTRYSHHVFERSILAQPKVKENYYRMLDSLLETDYFSIKDEGETAIVFMSSIKMCTDFTNWLSKRRPGVVIKRYVEGDNYEDNFINSDIVITTVGKSGAAVDKPMLRTNIRAIAIRSSQSIYQVFGRTRVLKSGATPRFVYLVCDDIPKQVEYHEHMVRILMDTALDYRHRRHNAIL